MTMFLVVRVANAFLHLVSLAILAYFILTLLRFNNRLVELLARFIYPFVKPFRRQGAIFRRKRRDFRHFLPGNRLLPHLPAEFPGEMCL